ncbi:ubiquitin carboxyl-terminal hydrolase-domain-containing protein [Dimargaris cristalligena]|uniref:Ubiquitin carboxyl-terminal hydrolase-domain-containing protein n=1 Tax=Dimargaris cristalligena TaxID=215637 RepID=A0A4P9ZSV8_9FUNG|nr:ubiquitin carboxyl-terminal hydrolase-domain-containing protein [Dimargaris cristalligena]|eukprot:RKP36537.1 ubiquitin carboxyl-terminal hydrolase-domain-containing protein [Dimargaris cristalligena]
MSNWAELAQIYDVPGQSAAYPVVRVTFDSYQNLIWAAYANGRITSYVPGSPITKYSSFIGHRDEISDLVAHPHGILSVSPTDVRLTTRGGLVKLSLAKRKLRHSYTSVAPSPTNPNAVYVSDRTGHALIMDLQNGGRVLREFRIDYDVIMIRHGTYLCTATSTGTIAIKDPMTLKTVSVVDSHLNSLGRLALCEPSLLLACGYSFQVGGVLLPNPEVLVYDCATKNNRPAGIYFEPGPELLAVNETTPSPEDAVLLVANRHGQFATFSGCEAPAAGDYASPVLYQVNLPEFTSLTSVAVAPTGEAIAFADNSGTLHIWSTSPHPCFVENPEPLALPGGAECLAPLLDMNSDAPLSLIGLPYYDGESPLLSVWRQHTTVSTQQRAPYIDPRILDKAKWNDFVGYAPNPRQRNRNQVMTHQARPSDIPKFRSERAREKLHTQRSRTSSYPTTPNGTSAASAASPTVLNSPALATVPVPAGSTKMPKYYRRVEIRYSRFGVEDFDFDFYNKSPYSGLETDITNSYCNSLLQALFYLPAFRAVAVAHMTLACPLDSCLLCELGFLFRMLEDAHGANCQATNFLRVFSTIRQADALGLLEPAKPSPQTAFGALIQNAVRFMLQQFHQEYSQPELPPLPTTWAAYGSIQSSPQGDYTPRFTLPYLTTAERTRVSFTQLLHAALEPHTQNRVWCEDCRQYQMMNQAKVCSTLPPILTINCAIKYNDEAQIWVGVGGGSSGSGRRWLPTRIAVSLRDHLDIRTAEDVDETEADQYTLYEVSAIVSEITEPGQPGHLVAQIRQTDSGQWYLFNDFLVRSTTEAEVFEFGQPWRTPVVLFLTRVGMAETAAPAIAELPNTLDPHTLITPAKYNRQTLAVPLTPDELPLPRGYVCALDAEFVVQNQAEIEVRSDGTRHLVRPNLLRLARVSVIRGRHPRKGEPFLDDYVAATVPIADYVTAYSGVRENDLNPRLSRKHLLPLKWVYRKLRYLVDTGCTFVGHGLSKDLRTINIYIPPAQIIDTVGIFRSQRHQRLVSLKFLAWCLLGEDIQRAAHCSVQDASIALRLYEKSEELKETGKFDDVLEDLYVQGQKLGWKLPDDQ